MDVNLELGAATAAVAAIFAGWVALRQYLRAERWKRAEFSIAQTSRIWNDETIAFCCCAIDWGVGPLIIPAKFRSLFPVGTFTVEHDWDLMVRALRPQLDKSYTFKATQGQFLLYRRAFDEFFSYFDALAIYCHLGVVTDQELSPLRDYFRQLREPGYWSDADSKRTNVAKESVFGDFIEAFYSERVPGLILASISSAKHKS